MAIAELPAAPVAALDDLTPEEQDDAEILDAYSRAVSSVAERLIPSVASLRVTRSMGGWAGQGSGSAVAFTPDGYLVTSAHVVAGTDKGTAVFVDGASSVLTEESIFYYIGIMRQDEAPPPWATARVERASDATGKSDWRRLD